MDGLLWRYNEYMRLEKCKAKYFLANGSVVVFEYLEENFAHLLGLHKLTDIQIIQFWIDKKNKSVKLRDVIRRIKKGFLTETMVKSSALYYKIADRYESFSYENLTTLSYTDAIVDFNPTVINSKLKSKYLLFEEKGNQEYNHLGIAEDNITGRQYIETYFHQSNRAYLNGQTIIKVKSFMLEGADGKVIVADAF